MTKHVGQKYFPDMTVFQSGSLNRLPLFLCAGHDLMLMGFKSPVGRDERNYKPRATGVH